MALNLPVLQQEPIARSFPEVTGIGGITAVPSTPAIPVWNLGHGRGMKSNKPVDLDPNKMYQMVDVGTGKVIGGGTGYDAVYNMSRTAIETSLDKGRKANWEIQEVTPKGEIIPVAADYYNKKKSVLGKIADFALPVIGAVVAGPLGAAAGSALSGVAQGRSIGDIAKGAAISGIGSFAGGQLLGGLGAGANGASGIAAGINPGAITPGILTGEALSSSLANLGSTAALNAGLTSGIGSGLGSLGGAMSGAGNAISNAALGDFINVVGSKGIGSALSSGLGGLGGAAINAATGIGATPAVGGPEEIVVTGAPKPTVNVGGIPIDIATGMASIPATALTGTTPTTTPNKGVLGTGLTAGQLLQLGGLGSSLIGGLLGSGGSSGGGGSLVPGGGAVTYTPMNRTQIGRTATGYGFDPFSYGQVSGGQPGEYTFFEPTAPTAVTATPATTPVVAKKDGGEIEDDNVRHLMEYHKNGGHNGPGPVKGVGTGQDDKIPAWLSDGEYVWSAQDVADLGDGSTDAGVRKLDQMRQMVRKQAGRKNIKKIAKPQKGIDHMLKAVGGMA